MNASKVVPLLPLLLTLGLGACSISSAPPPIPPSVQQPAAEERAVEKVSTPPPFTMISNVIHDLVTKNYWSYAPSGTTTHCNEFVRDVATKLFGTKMLSTFNATATQQATNIQADRNWQKIAGRTWQVRLASAAALAKQGYFVVLTLQDFSKGGHGHITVVRDNGDLSQAGQHLGAPCNTSGVDEDVRMTCAFLQTQLEQTQMYWYSVKPTG